MLSILAYCAILHTAQAQNREIPAERFELVKAYLQKQAGFSGMVTIASGGAVRYQEGFGFADRERKVPFSAQTLCTIGSITKPFTATAILLLMDQGKLHPEDPITTYFSNVPTDKKGITLHQLMTHSAGLPDAIGDDYEAMTKEVFLKKAFETPLLFPPGTGYEYSNVGYSLLGMIVEQLSGQTYGDFLQKNIFEPAGMKTAGYSNAKADYTLLAHGYTADGKDWGTSKSKNWNGAEPYWNLKANGGLLMSAGDLFNWYLALRSGKILKPETLKLQITPQVAEGGGSWYGYGYAVQQNGQCIQHNGGNGIFRADFRWFPKLDLCLIAATNDARVRLFRLDDEIAQILLSGEMPTQIEWKTVDLQTFPANPNQIAAKAMLNLLAQKGAAEAGTFIDQYCSPGIVQRNGKQSLIDMFGMLSKDNAGQPVKAVLEAGNQVQLVLPAAEPGMQIRLSLRFLAEKIDGIGAEMENSR